jgi:uncharacterized membrane protein
MNIFLHTEKCGNPTIDLYLPVAKPHFVTQTIASLVKVCVCCIVFFSTIAACAQDSAAIAEAAYTKSITERSAKIIQTLDISDSIQYQQVLSILVQQYRNINQAQQVQKNAANAIKQQTVDAAEIATQIKQTEVLKASHLEQYHQAFIAQATPLLTEKQMELLKDGITYRIFPITYAAYLDMIPTLIDAQKVKIFEWLKEARELAMDGESSEKKHAVFGKFKGRINNYLSSEGYDLKKETSDWQLRIKARNATK